MDKTHHGRSRPTSHAINCTFADPQLDGQSCALVHLQPTAGIRELWRASSGQCRAHPRVLQRHDGYYSSIFPIERPWSLSEDSFPLGSASGHASAADGRRACSTPAALLNGVALGERRWPPEASPSNETHPSVFVPAGCTVPEFSSQRACETLAGFKSIFLGGSSLTRHMLQALHMITTGNLIRGAFHDATNVSHDCWCDGQFSEALKCRLQRDLHAARRLCGGTVPFEFAHDMELPRIPGVREPIRWDQIICGTTLGRLPLSAKPAFIWLHAGPQMHSNSARAWNDVVQPAIQQIRAHSNACGRKVVVAFAGIDSQSRVLDRKYPNQRREAAASFNAELGRKCRMHGVWHVDFANLTLNAQTSDGYGLWRAPCPPLARSCFIGSPMALSLLHPVCRYHWLSDVNLAKAHVLLRLMELALSTTTYAPGVL